jgi:putative heme-binding domain-containing protein
MQYSQRDPNRDKKHGRVYRLVGTEQKLVKPVTQAGKKVEEILEQVREYEWRTRYRARRELQGRPAAEVLPAVAEWVAKLDPKDPMYDRLCCEALWIQQSHHKVDRTLAEKVVMSAKAFEARAAATHVLADEREFLADVLPILIRASADSHPRVQTEAVRGLSFFSESSAMAAVAEVTKKPLDYWTRYTVEATLAANEPAWRQDYLTGKIAKDTPEAAKIMASILASNKSGGAAAPWLKQLLGTDEQTPETRNKAMTALAGLKGNPSNGRVVFQRLCISCHKVGNGEGQDFGPNLDKVAERSKTRYKLVESLIDPNAEVEAKYLSTRVDTLDGKSITGLLVSESKTELVIFDGKDKKTIKVDDIDRKQQLKQSSMPEGLAGSMAPSEFLDLIEYLATLK